MDGGRWRLFSRSPCAVRDGSLLRQGLASTEVVLLGVWSPIDAMGLIKFGSGARVSDSLLWLELLIYSVVWVNGRVRDSWQFAQQSVERGSI
jgi:hypothetical protein